MNSVQTDNSFLEVKIKMRIDNLPSGDIRVLDCFAGTGLIWKTIKSTIPERNIRVLGIDQKKNNGIYLRGDNRKFLYNIDFSVFNVIDCDAYGVPYNQLKIILKNNLTPGTIIFVTFIQSMFGRLPQGMLIDLGYSKKMISKCPDLFNKKGIEKLKQWLALNSIEQIKRYSYQQKHYLCFSIK